MGWQAFGTTAEKSACRPTSALPLDYSSLGDLDDIDQDEESDSSDAADESGERTATPAIPFVLRCMLSQLSVWISRTVTLVFFMYNIDVYVGSFEPLQPHKQVE